jgi:hypothetical protein
MRGAIIFVFDLTNPQPDELARRRDHGYFSSSSDMMCLRSTGLQLPTMP